MITVEVLVLKGAMASSVAITLDILHTANMLRKTAGLAPVFRISVTGSGARAARALCGTAGASGNDMPDLLVLPGMGFASEAAITQGLARRDALAARKRILAVAKTGGIVAASCSSVFLLASTDMLAGRRATTTWWLAPIFRRMFPDVQLDSDALIVTDEKIVTAGAAMAQTDLMLALIARHASPALADGCARYLLLDERRSQSSFITLGLLAVTDERVAQAQAWAQDRLDQGISVDGLAAAAGLTPRTFARRIERVTGLSPVRFLQRLKVEQAVKLMRTTRLPFDEIAQRVGYAEPSTLRRLLRKERGTSPRAENGLMDKQTV